MTGNGDFRKPLYVLLYHPWMEGFERYFRAHMAWLHENGFESIPLEGVLRYIKGAEGLISERPVAITLDDGTIENYTIAYPILKEYGFTGTAFAPTAEKYIEMSGKDWWVEVEREGVLRIEGHSHSHALAFANDHVCDFFIKDNKAREPIIRGLDTRPGTPIFELSYELVLKRFLPDPVLVETCTDHVRRHGGVAFFHKNNWKEEMFNLFSDYTGNRGRYETEDEKRERVREELDLPKSIIEGLIGHEKKVRFFAYPFGAYDAGLIGQVRTAGYEAALTTDAGGNRPGDDPFMIKRMTIVEEASFGGMETIFKEYSTGTER